VPGVFCVHPKKQIPIPKKQIPIPSKKQIPIPKAAELKAKTEAEAKQKAEQAAKAKAEADKAAEAKKAALSKILLKFVKSKDKFDGSVTYRHKNYNYYNNSNGTTLFTQIQDGSIHANSVYLSSDWIFHKTFIVKIGDTTEEFSGRVTTNVVSGVIEDVYLNSSDSENLVKLIATAEPNTPIMVRLLGNYRHDFNLRSSHRQAMKDTWELYQLLKI
jgi:hypothetical protein